MKTMTMMEMNEADISTAKRIAKRLGFAQHVYTSTSDIIGLFCLPDHAGHRHGCVVKTKEFGFMYVSDLEDMQLHDIHEEQTKRPDPRYKVVRVYRNSARKTTLRRNLSRADAQSVVMQYPATDRSMVVYYEQ